MRPRSLCASLLAGFLIAPAILGVMMTTASPSSSSSGVTPDWHQPSHECNESCPKPCDIDCPIPCDIECPPICVVPCPPVCVTPPCPVPYPGVGVGVGIGGGAPLAAPHRAVPKAFPKTGGDPTVKEASTNQMPLELMLIGSAMLAASAAGMVVSQRLKKQA